MTEEENGEDINWGDQLDDILNQRKEDAVGDATENLANLLDLFYSNLLEKSFNKKQALLLTKVYLEGIVKRISGKGKGK